MFDVHVHSAPDVIERAGFDDQLALQYRQAGFTGFALKAHHESTVGRARTMANVSGLSVAGGVTLNHAVGGINPAAVLASLTSGGRVVWFPTSDAHTQQRAHLPRLCDLDARLGASALAVPPVLVRTADVARIHLVLDMIAEHDAALCTGHLSTAECRWLWGQAKRRGIRRFLLTHPSYTVPAMGLADIAEFADRGAFVEVTAYQLWHQPGMTPAGLAAVARAARERLILASDAGQPNSPPPPEALLRLIDTLGREGLDRSRFSAAAGDIAQDLVFR